MLSFYFFLSSMLLYVMIIYNCEIIYLPYAKIIIIYESFHFYKIIFCESFFCIIVATVLLHNMQMHVFTCFFFLNIILYIFSKGTT